MSEIPEPTIEDIAAARQSSDGKIPSTILDAFLPKPKTIFGQTLVPLTAGHELLLGQLDHPLATGQPMEDSDVLMALFVFSRPSRDLFAMVSNDTFEPAFFKFIDSIPPADIEKLGHDMVAHWVSGRATAIALESKNAQKKTADLAGY